jgi:hypothetical protein
MSLINAYSRESFADRAVLISMTILAAKLISNQGSDIKD